MRPSLKYWIFNWIFKFSICSKMTVTKVNHTLMAWKQIFSKSRVKGKTLGGRGIASVPGSVLMHQESVFIKYLSHWSSDTNNKQNANCIFVSELPPC